MNEIGYDGVIIECVFMLDEVLNDGFRTNIGQPPANRMLLKKGVYLKFGCIYLTPTPF